MIIALYLMTFRAYADLKKGKVMQMVDPKEFLEQVKHYDTHITIKQAEADKLRAMMLKITPTLKQDVVSSSGSQDKLGDAIVKIVDLEDEINEAIDNFVTKKREVRSVIDRIPDSDQYAVISRKYLLNETLEQIAVEMNMSYRNVCYIHGKALQTVSKILKETFH